MSVDAVESGRLVVDVRSDAQEPVSVAPDVGGPRPGPARGRRGRDAVAALSIATLTALAIWFLVYSLVLTGLQEHGAQARLYDRFRLQLATATAPLGGAIGPGSPVALLSAPSAGLHDVVVVEGTTAGQLTAGPGHLSDTPLPGQAGVSVLMGRSVTFGAPFRRIASMKVGERIIATTGQGVFAFEVYDIWHPGDGPPRPLKTDQAGLTLVSSESSGWRSGWAPSRTVYVEAVEVHGRAQPRPAGMPTSVSRASLPMQGNPKALIAFVFWFEALTAAIALTLLSWFRWGRRQTWMVAVPVVAGVLWGASGALVQLLPNVI